MAPTATARKRLPESTTDPLLILEDYARDDELIRNSDQFLEHVASVVASWGELHEKRIAALVTRSTTVTDADSYAQIAEWLKEAAEREQETAEFFKPRKSLGDKLHKIICSRESVMLAPLRAWTQKAKDAWNRYRIEDERKRREEEQRIAEAERRDQQARLEREAALLETRGETLLAEQVLQQAIDQPAPVVIIKTELPKVAGVSGRQNWTWRPVGGDTPQARERAARLVPREFLKLDDVKLNAFAKAHKGTQRIPGIEFYDAGSVSVRR